ncbi:YrpD family protein [Paenibacillus polymyxa]|uniref:YrpD family protein n=1 Tax=Paenibacillus polymyxa TaxID=1406 RepID=UPI002025B213|nr:YrpD family protein [Paenibacillus polymyxa]URJ59654.1 YrpD family protein [Paenibacillus polymyxa]
MKKVKFSIIIFLLFSSIGVTASANNEDITEKVSDSVTQSTYGLEHSKNVTVKNDAEVSQEKINNFIIQAKKVVREEKANSQSFKASIESSTYETVDYCYLDDTNLYFYEDSSIKDPELIILPVENGREETHVIKPQAIQGGFGGRVLVNSTTGNYIETRAITTSSNSTLLATNGTPYMYTGFTARGLEVDAGLAYSKGDAPGVWQPYLKIGGDDPLSTSYLLDGYNQVQYKNGYITGQPVQMDLWRNYTSGVEHNAVRLKLAGTAICADLGCSRHGDTKLTTIFSKSNIGVSSVVNYKLLATIAGSGASGQMNSTLSEISIDGIAKTPVKDEVANTQVTISGNSASFKLSK